MSRVLGIDPGRDGAGVLLDGRSVISWWLTADLLPGKGYDADALAGRLRSTHAAHRIDLVVLELYAGRPGEGRGSGMTIGVGWGIWRGAAAGLGIPVITPASSSWTRTLFRDVQGEGKERSIAVAGTLDLDLTPGRRRKPHDGLADAACLSLYGQTHPLARSAT